MRWLLRLVLCLVSVIVLSHSVLSQQKVYAFLVYSGDDDSRHLDSLRIGANRLREALVEGWGVEPANIHPVVCGGGLDKSGFLKELDDWVGKADEDDVFVFYLIGHGGEGEIWLSIGERKLSYEERHVEHKAIADSLKAGRALRNIVILDHCQAGSAIVGTHFSDSFEGFKTYDSKEPERFWALTSTDAAGGSKIRALWEPRLEDVGSWFDVGGGTVFSTHLAEEISSGEKDLREVFESASVLRSGETSTDMSPQIWPATGILVIGENPVTATFTAPKSTSASGACAGFTAWIKTDKTTYRLNEAVRITVYVSQPATISIRDFSGGSVTQLPVGKELTETTKHVPAGTYQIPPARAAYALTACAPGLDRLELIATNDQGCKVTVDVTVTVLK